MTEIKIKGDGWQILIEVHPGINKEIKKKVYELAEKAFDIIPEKKL